VGVVLLLLGVAAYVGRRVGPGVWEKYQLLRLQRQLETEVLPEGRVIFSTRDDDYAALPATPGQGMGSYWGSWAPTPYGPPVRRSSGPRYVGWIPRAWWRFAPVLTGEPDGERLILARIVRRPDGAARLVVLRAAETSYLHGELSVYAELISPGSLFGVPRFICRTDSHRTAVSQVRVFADRPDPAGPGRIIVPVAMYGVGKTVGYSSKYRKDGYAVTRCDGEIKVRVNDDDEIFLEVPQPSEEGSYPTSEVVYP